jgi:hypothetical protein
MQDYPEPTELDNGLTWTAEYRGHEWARYGSFYFIIVLRRAGAVVARLNVEVGDYVYGDITCRFTSSEIREKVRCDLNDLARRGESNTSALL